MLTRSYRTEKHHGLEDKRLKHLEVTCYSRSDNGKWALKMQWANTGGFISPGGGNTKATGNGVHDKLDRSFQSRPAHHAHETTVSSLWCYMNWAGEEVVVGSSHRIGSPAELLVASCFTVPPDD